MKQKDIALLVVVVVFSAIIAFVLSNVILGHSNNSQSAEVVQPIYSNFKVPGSTYFNGSSIDPTETITIGNSANPSPFPANSNNQ